MVPDGDYLGMGVPGNFPMGPNARKAKSNYENHNGVFTSPKKVSYNAFVHRINSTYIKNEKQKPNPKKNTTHYYENQDSIVNDTAPLCCEKR